MQFVGNTFRFEHSFSQMDCLVKKANLLRRTTLLYQQRLEKRCSDLKLAEAEAITQNSSFFIFLFLQIISN